MSMVAQAKRRIERARRRREQQQIIREAVADAETPTGAVAFPDYDCSRVQIVLTEGEMRVDVPNALDQARCQGALQWHVVRFRDMDGGAMLVEFER